MSVDPTTGRFIPLFESDVASSMIDEKIDVGPYMVSASSVFLNGENGLVTVSEGEWNGFYVGTCTTNRSIPTQSLAMELSRKEAEAVVAVGDFVGDEFYLDKDSKKRGVFCYAYQNSVVNNKLLNASCKELFGDGVERCEEFKNAVETLTGQRRELGFGNKLKESFIRGFGELPEGILNGFYFAVGMGIAAGLGIFRKFGKHLKNAFGLNSGNGGPAKPAFIPVDPPIENDTAACWGASLFLGFAGLLVIEAGGGLYGGLKNGLIYVEDAVVATGAKVAAVAVSAALSVVQINGGPQVSRMWTRW